MSSANDAKLGASNTALLDVKDNWARWSIDGQQKQLRESAHQYCLFCICHSNAASAGLQTARNTGAAGHAIGTQWLRQVAQFAPGAGSARHAGRAYGSATDRDF